MKLAFGDIFHGPRQNLCGPWIIPCQINKEFRITSQVLTKLGVFVVPVVLITLQIFSSTHFIVSDL